MGNSTVLLLWIFIWVVATRSYGQTDTLPGPQRIENKITPINKAGVDDGGYQTIQERMKALGVSGVSIAIFDRGQISWAKGYGLSDKSRASRVDTATLFQAASISKPVTSVATLRLVEANTLALDEDVNGKLRRWKVPDNGYTATEKVTPRRIVSHTAGLSVHGFLGYNRGDKLPTLPAILDGLPPANSPPVRVIDTPGKKEIYSGGGFTLLQLLLEDVTGKPFGALMKELVLRPAGMTQSTFALLLPRDKASLAAKGYQENGDTVDGGYHVYPELAAAGLWTTPSDLARFMLNISGSYRGDTGILQPATVRKMLIKIPGAGGLGFGVDGAGETLRFRHSGGNAGFSCYAVCFAETGRGVSIMTNSDNGTQLIHELIRSISREYHWPAMWPRE